jgi:ribosome-associated protein
MKQTDSLPLELSRFLLEKKAKEIKVLDLRGKTDFTDYFVIATVESDPQAQAAADHLIRGAKKELGMTPHHREGNYKNSNWLIIDFLTVVVHLFKPEERERYDLEKLWFEAEITEINDGETAADELR